MNSPKQKGKARAIPDLSTLQALILPHASPGRDTRQIGISNIDQESTESSPTRPTGHSPALRSRVVGRNKKQQVSSIAIDITADSYTYDKSRLDKPPPAAQRVTQATPEHM